MNGSLLPTLLRHKDSVLKALPFSFGFLRRFESSITSATNSADKITEEYLVQTRARIFGYRIGDGNRSGAKLLKKKLPIDKIKNYYPESPEDKDPFFEHPRIEKCVIAATLQNVHIDLENA